MIFKKKYKHTEIPTVKYRKKNNMKKARKTFLSGKINKLEKF